MFSTYSSNYYVSLFEYDSPSEYNSKCHYQTWDIDVGSFKITSPPESNKEDLEFIEDFPYAVNSMEVIRIKDVYKLKKLLCT